MNRKTMLTRALLLALSLLVCLGMVFTSCGDDEEPPATEPTQSTPAPSTSSSDDTTGSSNDAESSVPQDSSSVDSGAGDESSTPESDEGNDSSTSESDGSGDSSTEDSSTVDSSNTGDSSTTDSSNTGDSSTVDSSNTEDSSTVDSSNTGDSSTVDSSNTEDSSTTDSSNTTDSSEDPIIPDPPACEHTGGEATCEKLAVCELCGEEYGDYAAHKGGTATCVTFAKCDVCGQLYGDYADHEYVEEVVPPSCTEVGYTKVTCKVEGCTYSKTKDETNKVAHTGGIATCQAKAVCEVCGNEYGKIAAHNYKETVVAPTCEADGYTLKECQTEGCDDFRKIDIKEKLNHTGGIATCQKLAVCEREGCGMEYGELGNHTLEKLGEFVPADCENHGYQMYECVVEGCDHEEEGDVEEALKHTGGTATCIALAVCEREGCGKEYGEFADHDYKYDITEPKCTEGGYTTVTCNVEGCQYKEITDEKEEIGHTGGLATCQKLAVCEREGCGMEYGELADHDYKYDVTPQTCTEDGYTTVTCNVEGCQYNQIVDPTEKLGHDYNVVVTDPNCEEIGFTTTTCKREGCDYKEITDEKPALDHDWTLSAEASCKTEGYNEFVCNRVARGETCGETKREFVSEARHQYIDVNAPKIGATCCTNAKFECKVCQTEFEMYAEDLETYPQNKATNNHVYDVEIEVVDPKCSAEGYTVYGCSAGECGNTIKDKYTARTAHEFFDLNEFDEICCMVCAQSYRNITTVVTDGDETLCLGCEGECTCGLKVEWVGYVKPLAPEAITAGEAFTKDFSENAAEIAGGLIKLTSENEASYVIVIGETTIEVKGTEVIVDLYKFEAVETVTITSDIDAQVVFYKSL